MKNSTKQISQSLDARIAKLEAELTGLKKSVPHPPLTQMLRQLFDANFISMARANVDGRLLDVNKAWEDMVGYSREELLSGDVTWRTLTPPEYKRLSELAVQQILLRGRAETYEKEYQRKNGDRVPVILSVAASDLSGEDCLCVALNLSEIRDAEVRIRKSEQQYRMLVETIPQIVFLSDNQGNLLYVNQRFADFTGHDLEEPLNQAWTDLIHPDDMPLVMQQWQHSAETGKDFELELRHRYHDGTFHWVLCRSIGIPDENGVHTQWIGTATDIDDQKRAQSELKQREEQFHLMADGIPQIVWTASAEGDIDFFNHRWLEYTGLTVEQSLNGAWELLIHPGDLVEYNKKWKDAIQTGQTYEFEFRLKRVLGLKAIEAPYIWHLCRAVAMKNSAGRIIKWFGTWTDIHQQKE